MALILLCIDRFQNHRTLIMNSYLYIEKSSGSTRNISGRTLNTIFFYYLLWVSKFLTTLIFSGKSEAMCQFFNKRGYPVSFDSFERGTTVSNKLIDSQRYTRLRRITLINLCVVGRTWTKTANFLHLYFN